jgi:hypothetical protein
VDTSPTSVLQAHVARFNNAVRSGDFAEMVDGFALNAEMAFDGAGSQCLPGAGKTS